MKKGKTLVEILVIGCVVTLMIICSPLSQYAQAALTKAVAVLDNWTAVAQNTVVNGTVVDISPNYQSTLYIDTALTSTTAQANGASILVQISSNTTGNNAWHTMAAFGGPTGTGAARNITSNVTAGDTNFNMTNTTGFANGNLYYIKDSTIANSELFYQKALSANANITVVDGATNAHAANTTAYNITGQYTVAIPDSANRFRVVVDNTKDASGSTMDVRTKVSKITAI